MKKISTIFLSMVLLITTSCASIFSKSKWPISINSTPSESKILITNKKGIEVFNGYTPANLKLKSGSGFFTKASYLVRFEKEGYETKIVPVKFKLNSWYYGNLLFGGLLGILIIDPATGAMYKLDTEFLNEKLIEKDTFGFQNKEGLNILELNDTPKEWKKHLIQIAK